MAHSEEELLARLEAGDTTLWPEGNIAADRLGWLAAPQQIDRERKDLRSWADSIDQETIVVLGAGGSAHCPRALADVAQTFGEPLGRQLIVCDTTDPSTLESLPLEDAFVIVSSKSGGVFETKLLFDYARTRQRDPKRYAVIADPGTPLAQFAKNFRVSRLFENRPDVAGSYGALTYVGTVPAALVGYDLEELCGRALEIDRIAAVTAGIAMAEAALEGRDKVTLHCDEHPRAASGWFEHIISQSTGKDRTGLIPVMTSEIEDGDDRYAVELTLTNAHELGAAFFDYEIRAVIAAHIFGVDPFSAPNGMETTVGAEALLANFPLPPVGGQAAEKLQPYLEDEIRPGDYVSIEAYLPYGNDAMLETVRRAVRDRNDGIAVTAGYGPRVNHTTGQLHREGTPSAITVQLFPGSPRPAVAVPDAPYGFDAVITAQAIADRDALERRGLRHITIEIDDLSELV